jgi:hypothetical protein
MINSQTSTSTTITADTVHHATGVEEIKLESIPPELRPFSKFDGVMAKHPAGTVTLSDVIAEVKGSALEGAIAEVRAAHKAGNPDECTRLKKLLPAITPSGVFSQRNNSCLTESSCLLCLDFDDVPGDMVAAFTKLECDPHTLASFTSPSGTGLKVFASYRGGADQHRAAFQTALDHYSRLGVGGLDPATKDLARLCFLSHDPAAYLNPDAIPFVPAKPAVPVGKTPLHANASTRAPAAEADVQAALRFISPDVPNAEWVEVGMALHNWDPVAGLDIWEIWSQPGKTYREGETARRWRSFDAQPGGITIASLFRRAKEGGWQRQAAGGDTRGTGSRAQDQSSANLDVVVLPSGDVTISATAAAIFQKMVPAKKLFVRGGTIVEVVEQGDAMILDLVSPEAFRSRAEQYARLMAWRSGGGGGPVLKESIMSVDTSKALMASTEARLLPPIANVLNSPAIVPDGQGGTLVLGPGYHAHAGGIFVTGGELPPVVGIDEAVRQLHWLIEEIDFQSPGDRARALAAIITPALRIGGFLAGPVPIDFAEADASQSGKGYRHHMVCAIYRENARMVSMKIGGVGSVDESFSNALLSGKPFICLDNFRGSLASAHLEGFITAPALFPARVPFKGEVLVDPKRYLLQMSSNGLLTTADLANRLSICRIRKREGFAYRDTLGAIQARQPYYLGCVHAVVRKWVGQGSPKTTETRHNQREWCQTLDWIVQNLLGTVPLMDGHKAAQTRTSTPDLTWLRAVAIAIEQDNRLDVALIASEIFELCESHDIEIPGNPADETRARQRIGLIMKRVFQSGETVEAEGFRITRGQRPYQKSNGTHEVGHEYRFTR